MAINNLTHFVLIDFENVPGVDLSVLGRHPMTVTLFLGPKSKLKAGLVEQITTLPFEVRLIKVGLIKKNALDFVLAYHLGEMAPRYPRGHYYIVSGDQDFEPLVTYLREHNLHISQHSDLASLPFLAALPKAAAVPAIVNSPALAPVALPVPLVPKIVDPPKPAVIAKPMAPKKPVVSREEKFIAGLKNSKKLNRPSTLKRLQAHIKNVLGKDETAEKVEAIISELIKTHVLSVAASGKVTYK